LKKVKTIHIILLAGLVHGLLYVFLIPPWQHYDEPGHFEYAWLIANRPGMPSSGEYDQGMRREVSASMVEHGFFQDLSIQPDLIAQNLPVWIGFSQTDDPPIYYWIAALPLRLVQTSDITFQLYLCRLISLIFFLVSILAAFGVISELTQPGNPARWLIPATLVLLPGITDLMTAVNNDGGAVMFFSLFLWAGVRMINRGFHLTRLVAVSLLALACYWTKNTAAIAMPLLVFPLLFSIFPKRRQKIAWLAIGMGILVSIMIFFTSGDVAYWYQSTSQPAPTRMATTQAPVGGYVFQTNTPSRGEPNNLIQLLSSSQVQEFRGKKVTLGYWIWANQPIQFHSPVLKSDSQSYSEPVEVTQTPTFHVYLAKITRNTRHLQVVLEAPTKPGVVIFLDGIVLLRGDFTSRGKPVFSDIFAQRGTWDGIPFVNPIRNASAENDWPRPRMLVQSLLRKISPLQPNMVLASLADWQNSRWYYRTTIKQLLRTFWGQFGWGHIRLSRNVYIMLSILTTLGVIGSLVRLWRNRIGIAWPILAFLGAAILGIWGAALVRGILSIAGAVFIPSARYAYPVIVPTIGVLCLGWAEWPHLVQRWIPLPAKTKITIYIILFLLFDLLSIWTIARFYH
jgi:hypothetical protein